MQHFVLLLGYGRLQVFSDGVKDTDGKAKAKAKHIQHKPKSLCHGDLSLWKDVMSESSCWHTRLVTKTHH